VALITVIAQHYVLCALPYGAEKRDCGVTSLTDYLARSDAEQLADLALDGRYSVTFYDAACEKKPPTPAAFTYRVTWRQLSVPL